MASLGQGELMNLNRLDEAADCHLRGGILLLKLSGTDRSDKEITVVVHIDKIVVVSGDLDFPDRPPDCKLRFRVTRLDL